MRIYLIMLVCFIACGLVIGCSDDDSTCPQSPEQPLAQFARIEGYENCQGTYYSFRISILYPATSDTLVNLLVDETDSGTTLTITAADPHFSDFVSMLTNGVNDQLRTATELHPGGCTSGSQGSESTLLLGGLKRDFLVDLEGTQVTKILVHLDELFIYRGSGTTSYGAAYRVVFMGRP